MNSLSQDLRNACTVLLCCKGANDANMQLVLA